MAWRKWFQGLVAAIVGGVATSVVAVIVDPLKFNIGDGLYNLLAVMAVSGIFSGAMYLKEHPVPDEKL